MVRGRWKLRGKALASGLISLVLYLLMYAYEDEILNWTTRGRWYFVVPVMVAFVFSFFHGAFTGYFWELLGVRARTSKAKRK